MHLTPASLYLSNSDRDVFLYTKRFGSGIDLTYPCRSHCVSNVSNFNINLPRPQVASETGVAKICSNAVPTSNATPHNCLPTTYFRGPFMSIYTHIFASGQHVRVFADPRTTPPPSPTHKDECDHRSTFNVQPLSLNMRCFPSATLPIPPSLFYHPLHLS